MAVSDEAQIAAIITELNGWSHQEIVGLSRQVAVAVFEATPVDTGYAKSNWVASIGSVDETTVGVKPSKGVHTGGTHSKAGLAVSSVDSSRFDGSLAALGGYTLEQGNIYIANSVPYIGALNDGWSKQAPTDFVFAAAAGALASFEAAR